MSKFIRLTNFLLNTNYIHKIVIKPNKYHIHIVNKQIYGHNWAIAGFGFGNISSYNYEIEVCKMTHSIDYITVSDWISKNQ